MSRETMHVKYTIMDLLCLWITWAVMLTLLKPLVSATGKAQKQSMMIAI